MIEHKLERLSGREIFVSSAERQPTWFAVL